MMNNQAQEKQHKLNSEIVMLIIEMLYIFLLSSLHLSLFFTQYFTIYLPNYLFNFWLWLWFSNEVSEIFLTKTEHKRSKIL